MDAGVISPSPVRGPSDPSDSHSSESDDEVPTIRSRSGGSSPGETLGRLCSWIATMCFCLCVFERNLPLHPMKVQRNGSCDTRRADREDCGVNGGGGVVKVASSWSSLSA